jgi:phosphoglycolate phosphatase-like HAD superfamily hydrolase
MIDINERPPAPRPVIFDIDGTLVDSNDAHAHAWVDALAEVGHHVAFARVRPLIGMGGDKVLPELAGLAEDSPEGKRIAKRRGEIFRTRYFPTVPGIPGAQELVSHLVREGHALAVASSARKEELEDLLRCAGVDRLIKLRTSSSDTDNSKPDPDVVHAALKQLGVDASDSIMIGDTPYDIEAARRAGVETIAFRSGGWSDKDLKGAVAIYDGPAHLRREYESSPLRRPAGRRTIARESG